MGSMCLNGTHAYDCRTTRQPSESLISHQRTFEVNTGNNNNQTSDRPIIFMGSTDLFEKFFTISIESEAA
jgi:hypothetical protein